MSLLGNIVLNAMTPLSLFFFLGIANTFIALPVFAQSHDLPRTKIEKVLTAYAKATGCDFEMDKKNIVRIDLNGDEDIVYVALFIIDEDCSGGSGSWTSNLAVLDQNTERAAKTEIYVRPEMTMPVAPGVGLPRFIDRIFIKNKQLWFAGRIHADIDGNNFPSIPVESQVQLHKSEVSVSGKTKRTIYYWRSAKDFPG